MGHAAIRVRRVRPDDAAAITAVHAAAVRTGCRSHYGAGEIERWVAESRVADGLERRDVFVAQVRADVRGFGEVEDDRIQALYVDPAADVRGVGTMLLHALEDTARLRGRTQLVLDASLNAVSFYARHGWRAIGPSRRVSPSGEPIACVRMEKRVPAARLVVRPERAGDEAAIRAVHDGAFARAAEGRLVERLRADAALALSLVATLDDAIVGHLAMSPVAVDGIAGVFGLGPVAAAPAYQGSGIGARLVEEGVARLREHGARAVVVLGEPAYYGRFGFVPAVRLGMRWEHPAPDGAFMVAALVPSDFGETATDAIVRYHPAFDRV